MNNDDPLYFGYSAYVMPKETRQSTQYRTDPVQLPSDAGSGTRKTSIWTPEDDEILMAQRAKGSDWKTIATNHFPEKTSNACRKRHERLMERRNAEDWGGPKLETLAKEYMAVRREMWGILADRVSEKWQVIEAKVRSFPGKSFVPAVPVLILSQCMEMGLKNIHAAHRTAQRKERGMEKADSGIGLEDAEGDLEDRIVPQSSQAAMRRDDERRPSRGGNMSIQSMLSPEGSPSYSE